MKKKEPKNHEMNKKSFHMFYLVENVSRDRRMKDKRNMKKSEEKEKQKRCAMRSEEKN